MSDKREFVAKYMPPSAWVIKLEGGGKLPDDLTGSYTRKVLADEAIALYEAERDRPKREYRPSRKRVEKNGTDKTSTSK